MVYCVLSSKGGNTHGKDTIEELYRGDKYDIMSAVTAKALQLGIDERTEEGRTWIEMHLVRRNLMVSKKRKRAVAMLHREKLGTEPLITHTYPLLEDRRVV